MQEKRDLVISIAKTFRSSGLTHDDLVQEGRLAYMRAEQTFDETLGVKFETYASRIIKNRFIDLLRKEKDSTTLIETSTGYTIEDEYQIIEKSKIVQKILNEQCTDIEKAIFKSYALGMRYNEISKIFDVTKKKIDNTIQKVRNKIRQAL